MDKYNLGLLSMVVFWLVIAGVAYYSESVFWLITFFVWAGLIILYLFFIIPTDDTKQLNTQKEVEIDENDEKKA
jgi:hypothetical protein